MTQRRPQGRRTQRRAPRRKLSWENLAFEIPLTAAADSTIANLTPEPMQTVHLGVGSATIHRLIGNFAFMTQEGATDSTEYVVAIGIGVVTLEAFSAGAIPDPLSDFNYPWYYWTTRTFKAQTIDSPQTQQWDIDIRSRRRLRDGHVLMIHWETPVNDDPTRVHSALRLLWSQEP